MNVIALSGRLVRDPNMQQSGVCRFCVAVNRHTKDGGADFINCVAFGKQAEFVSKYFFKGMKIDLTGHLQIGNYTNKDGQRVNTADVIVDHAEFGESRKAAASEGLVEGDESQTRTGKPMEEEPSFMQIPDDGSELEGLPFE